MTAFTTFQVYHLKSSNHGTSSSADRGSPLRERESFVGFDSVADSTAERTGLALEIRSAALDGIYERKSNRLSNPSACLDNCILMWSMILHQR